MSKLFSFSLILITVALGFYGVSTSLDNNGTTNSTFTEDGKVLGIHHLTLNNGVDQGIFESFVTDEFVPRANDIWPGITLRIMKGERNAEAGEYLLVYDIQSVWVRDFFYPAEGDPSEAAEAITSRCGEQCNMLWEKLFQMAATTDWTDYVELVK